MKRWIELPFAVTMTGLAACAEDPLPPSQAPRNPDPPVVYEAVPAVTPDPPVLPSTAGLSPFSIHSGAHDDFCVESSTHGEIRLWKCHARANQRWMLAHQPDGSVQIVGSHGTCVGHGALANSQLTLGPCADARNRYRLVDGRFTDVVSGACLTASTFENHGPVFLDGCNPANAGQAWTVGPAVVANPPVPQAEDPLVAARVREETAWNKAQVTGCALPVALTGCDAVRLYLAKYPSGSHADEANRAVASAAPQMERLQKDENAWQGASVTTCRAHVAKDACDGVELYVTKYPAGIHADEARAILQPLTPSP